MNIIREFCIKNRIYVLSVILTFSILITILQIEIFSSGFLKVIYQPFLVNFLGASFVLMLIWIISSTFIVLYTNILTKKKAKLYLSVIPLIVILEISAILSFFTFNSNGIFPSSYGGLLGEFIIKWPENLQGDAPSFLNYSTRILRLILLNVIILTMLFPKNSLNQFKKLISFLLISLKSISFKPKPKKTPENPSNDNALDSSEQEIEITPQNDIGSFSDDDLAPKDPFAVNDDVVSHTFNPNINENLNWKLPDKEILASIESGTQSENEITIKKDLIEKTLSEHGIEVSVDQVKSGPTVTMYGLAPGYGNSKRVRVDHILAREKDLALALASQNIRFQSPVPGESLVGIEIPNSKTSAVGLKNLIFSKKSESFDKYDLPIALGTGSDNQSLYCDLAKLPHLLVAGATGSGKSVCINSIIAGFLMKKNPDELRLIMIDPKRVELTPYTGIPHLLTAPIVEPSEAIIALKLMVEEMQFRFKQLEEDNSKNIATYNEKSEKKNRVKMPYIVVIVDELADLMLTASSEVEKLLVRLAQLGRATGIHLVVATQRPSVDVVTGLIKANFPSRISFSVTSQIDSRTIIDSPGAEKLLGKGDMLFVPIDNPSPKRAQGIFISDEEIESIVQHWKNHKIYNPLKYLDLEKMVDMFSEEEVEINSEDSLILQAQNLARGQRTLSTSFLQRRLRIGYPRAARLMDELEEQGVVGPGDAGKAREVL
ncbi:MAG: DNA translocase FtsK [Chloroflexota bacterium]|nr:DNA translocase FtsK [Chloroflexota bacterium]